MEIDGLKLDENNQEFTYAVEFIKSTRQNVFLTGKAGTGKTTFLKYIKKTIKKNVVVIAPTGVAAINAGGNTIHSFFQIRPSVYVPNDVRLRVKPNPDDADKSTIFDHFQYNKEKLKIIRNLDLLIIDEISMVRCDLIDVVDKLLRVFCKNKSYLPFGGVQVLLIGDTFQLPPIANKEEWDILSKFYKSPFFFSSRIIEKLITKQNIHYIELKKVYRQKDHAFIGLLNRIRINEISDQDLENLNNNYNPRFDPDTKENYIILATHNKIVNGVNEEKLNKLEGELYTFEAEIDGVFPDNLYPTDFRLNIKNNAQVMFIKNDHGTEKKYYNGKIGKISSIEDDKIFINIDEGKDIELKKYTWENIRYKWNERLKKVEEEIIGTFTQFAIKLAWAITVHKSQGLTFEKVIADLSGAWDSGQVYVALSRCTSLKGLILKSEISRNNIKTSVDALEFAKNETSTIILNKKLEESKADVYYKKSFQEIRKGNYELGYENFLKAYKLKPNLDSLDIRRLLSIYFKKKKVREDIIAFISKQNKELLSNLTDLNNSYYEIQNNNESLINKIEKLERKIKRLKKVNDENMGKIKTLEDRSGKYLRSNIAQIRTIKYLQKELAIKDKELYKYRWVKWLFKK